jgi:hypothetical protein
MAHTLIQEGAMTIGEAKEIARSWIARETRDVEDYYGATLHGSSARASDEDELSPCSDIDTRIYVEKERVMGFNHPDRPYGPRTVHEDGLSLDVIYEYNLPQCLGHGEVNRDVVEYVLSQFWLFDEFAQADHRTILDDPTGQLGRLCDLVAQEGREPRWVEARMQGAAAAARERITMCAGQRAPFTGYHNTRLNQVTWFTLGVMPVLCGLPTLAQIDGITFRCAVRRCRVTLVRHGLADLHERLLAYLGWADLTRETVESWSDELASVYDLAADCLVTPFFGQFSVSRDSREKIFGGVRDLLAGEDHRDAVHYLLGIRGWIQNALENDGPPDLTVQARSRFDEMLAAVRFGPDEERHERETGLESILEPMLAAAKKIADQESSAVKSG